MASSKQATQATRAEIEKEAGELRLSLEGMSDAGVLDLSKKDHAAAHARLDELERVIYTMRRRDRAIGAAGAPSRTSPTAGGGGK